MICTRYGRWADDGYRVLNSYSRVIYTRPDAPRYIEPVKPPAEEALETYINLLERMKL